VKYQIYKLVVIVAILMVTAGAFFSWLAVDKLAHRWHHQNEPKIMFSIDEDGDIYTGHPVYLTTTNGEGWLDKQRIEQ